MPARKKKAAKKKTARKRPASRGGKKTPNIALWEAFVLELMKDSRSKGWAYQKAKAAIGEDESSLRYCEIAASRLMKNDEFMSMWDAARDERNKQLRIDAYDVLDEAHKMATANISDYVDDKGYLKVQLHEIPREISAAIQEVTEEEWYDADGQRRVRRKVKLHNKIQALDMVGKHMGVRAFEKLEVSLNDMQITVVSGIPAAPNSSKGKK